MDAKHIREDQVWPVLLFFNFFEVFSPILIIHVKVKDGFIWTYFLKHFH
jgi:hypothetical protein